MVLNKEACVDNMLSEIKIDILHADLYLTEQEQMQSVLDQVDFLSKNHDILRLSFCINVNSNKAFFETKKKILRSNNGIFPLNVLAQTPVDGSFIKAEVWSVNKYQNKTKYKCIDGLTYAVVKSVEGKFLFLSGAESSSVQGIQKETQIAFEKIRKILYAEDFTFAHIIRQWNYVHNIIKKEKKGNELIQNYQEFNDIRSFFYSNNNFTSGYPAATGIGISFGTTSIDCIAFKPSMDVKVHALKNKIQADAHKYSKRLLVGKLKQEHLKTTPKFERAKVIRKQGETICFISGTAAILGEDSVNKESVVFQADTTINIIKTLISKANFEYNNLELKSSNQLQMVKIYIAKKEHIKKIVDICNKKFPNITALLVLADICRDDLLMEIEAYATTTNNNGRL